MDAIVKYSTEALELAGLVVIMAGAIIATAVFAIQFYRVGFDSSYHNYRADLGRAILIGLELLIAADILNSLVVDPTLNGLAVLAGIVLVRTFLSFSLEVEINGHWPWEASRFQSAKKPPPADAAPGAER